MRHRRVNANREAAAAILEISDVADAS